MIKIDYQQLPPAILHRVLEAILLREGTDYGAVEMSLDTKKAQLLQRLQSGEATIVYHPKEGFCDVVATEYLGR